MGGDHSLAAFRLIIEGLCLVLVGLCGIVGNTWLIIWFSSKRNNFHQLMRVLAFCDLLYILTSSFVFGLPNIFTSVGSSSLYKHLVPVLLPLAQIGLSGSIYLTLAIAIERYATVCHPFFKVSNPWPSMVYILPSLTFAITYNIPKFFELTVKSEFIVNSTDTEAGNSENEDDFSNIIAQQIDETNTFDIDEKEKLIEKIAPTPLRLNPVYIKVYLVYLNLFTHGIIPFILLVVLNICIYRQMRLLQRPVCSGVEVKVQQRDIQLTKISLGIVAVFIGCHLVKWVPNIWELVEVGQNKSVVDWPTWLSYVTCISHLLTTFNCSVNFYIYAFKQRKRKRDRHYSHTEITNMEGHNLSMTEMGGVAGLSYKNAEYQ